MKTNQNGFKLSPKAAADFNERVRPADGSIMPHVTTGNTRRPASSSASVQQRSYKNNIAYDDLLDHHQVSCDV
jgi:hypothetical protein